METTKIKALVAVLLFMGGFVYGATPKVVKTVPANGAEDVRPGIQKMQIVFDQDMNLKGHFVCGGGESFPEVIGKPRWINSRTFGMTVKLRPDHEYLLSVNSKSYKHFKNLKFRNGQINLFAGENNFEFLQIDLHIFPHGYFL